ncbi:MAG TPA: DUF1343 domain-containing protein [Tepidisphaeraceae bacterium]|nr:DUF1343 domain-containing protein [Tepidisphaeraceae bacterium]
MPMSLRAILLAICLCLLPSHLLATVELGIDVLRDHDFKELQGKRLGLVANPASVDSHLIPTVDILHNSKQVKLVALFGPEHGIYGDEYAGNIVADKRDARTGLTAFSLYGKTHKPTKEMLANIDALVFDLQDNGARSYTYLSTLRDCIEGCADADKEFVVLDRPNPLGGNRIEGGLVQPGFESHVSYIPSVPYLHGMTFGELAQLIRDTYKPDFKKLTIIRMAGWTRDMTWSDTGLQWTPTSPHLPHVESAYAYPATGILGELYVMTIGVGYTLPFETVGSPWVSGDTLADALNHHYSDPGHYYLSKASTRPSALAQLHYPTTDQAVDDAPKGLYFQPVRFKPFYGTFKDTPCQGVQIRIDPHTTANLVELNFRLLQALDAPDIFAKAKSRHNMFDKVTGSPEARTRLTTGEPLQPLFDQWRNQCESFRTTRQKWLLY